MPADGSDAEPTVSQGSHVIRAPLMRPGPAELYTSTLGGLNPSVYPLPDDLALELSHRHQDVKLQPADGVVVARINALGGGYQRHGMAL